MHHKIIPVCTREDEPLPELDEWDIDPFRAAGNQYAWSGDKYQREKDAREEASQRYISLGRAPLAPRAVQQQQPGAMLAGGQADSQSGTRPLLVY